MNEFPMKLIGKELPISIVYQYEDEIDENINDTIYSAMFESSYVDFVRIFPMLKIDNRYFYLIENCDANIEDALTATIAEKDAEIERLKITLEIIADTAPQENLREFARQAIKEVNNDYSAYLNNMSETEYKRLILGSWNEVSHE